MAGGKIPNELQTRFEALKQPCIKISTQAVPMEQIALGESRFGGIPDVPSQFEWPRAEGLALFFVGQINFRETHQFDSQQLLPSDGTLLIFYEGGAKCWGFRPDDNKFWKIAYFSPDAPLMRRTTPADIPDWMIILPGKLTFSTSESYADAFDFAARELSRDEKYLYMDFQDLLPQRHGPNHQLLGHPRLVQNDMKLECQLTSNGIDTGSGEGHRSPRARELEPGASDWMLLLQFDTDDELQIMWGDVGTVYVLIRKQDLAQKRFDKSRICFQCS